MKQLTIQKVDIGDILRLRPIGTTLYRIVAINYVTKSVTLELVGGRVLDSDHAIGQFLIASKCSKTVRSVL